jgi:hypothetical protein
MSHMSIQKSRLTPMQTSFAYRKNYLSINGRHASGPKAEKSAVGGLIYP